MVKLFFFLRNCIINRKLYFFYPIYRLIGLLYSSEIPLTSKISNDITFKYGLYGIYISGDAKIESDVTIGGVWSDSKNKGALTIGKGTILYPGSKILGNVRVGENCQIRSNVVIWSDVPDNTTVVINKNACRMIDNV